MNDQVRATDLPPSRQLMQILWPGAMAAQAIYAAAKLGIADCLTGGAQTADELARATRTHAPTLRRLLHALTSLGLFVENASGAFEHTPLSETLRRDHPQSMRPLAIFLGAPFMWSSWGDLSATVATGRPAFDRVFGTNFFAHLAAHPDDAAIFNAAMTAGSAMSAPALVGAYDFSRFERIVDVGGGHGALLHGILSAHPTVRGVLFDLPGVVEGAAALRAAMGERCEIIGGDVFTTALPQGADAFLLKGVIHDWSDAEAVKILKSCRRAIRPDGRLLLFETVLQPGTSPANALMDLMMLVLVTGRERTEADFRALLADAGFALTQVIATPGPFIIEARPI